MKRPGPAARAERERSGAIRERNRTRAAVALLVTALLGIAFLAVKGDEYAEDYYDRTVPILNFVLKPHEQPPAELFWLFFLFGIGIIDYLTRSGFPG